MKQGDCLPVCKGMRVGVSVGVRRPPRGSGFFPSTVWVKGLELGGGGQCFYTLSRFSRVSRISLGHFD